MCSSSHWTVLFSFDHLLWKWRWVCCESGWCWLWRIWEYLHESYDEFDPTQFTPGTLSVGSGCELFVATDNCINVLSTFDGKLKRQIGCDRYREGELSKVQGIFATGDGYLFVSSEDCVHVFTTDGEHLNKFGGDDKERQGVFQQPWGMAVDWNGYLLIADIGRSKIQVF